MNNTREHIDELILKFADNNLNSEEEEALLHWIQQNSANRLYFKEQLIIIRNIKLPDVQFNAHQSLASLKSKKSMVFGSFTLIKRMAVAAAVIVTIVLCWLWVRNQNESSQNTVFVADNNMPLVFVLNDKSEITLSKNSVLIAPKEFDRNIRRVTLQGKAFFNIEENESQPFEIVACDFLIRVLGTGFEVDVDTIRNLICVSVHDGRVSLLHTPTGYSRILETNRQICLSLNGKILHETSLTNENYLSWKTGVLVFDNTPMSEVASELAKLYDKPVIFRQQQIGAYLINTKIVNQSFAQINTIFEVTLHITMVDVGDKIVIMETDSINQ